MEEVESESKVIKINCTRIVLPKAGVRSSCILGGGLGLFVLEDISKKSYVTEYGGPIIDFCQARLLQEEGKDTHLRSIHPMHLCYDGRVTENYSIEWYARHHLLGSFANDPYGSCHTPNVKIKEFEVFHQTPAGQFSSKRIFYVATKDLTAGSEIFFDYGQGYHRRHFDA